MNNFNAFLATKFYHNKIENWLWFFGILIIGFLLKNLFSTLLTRGIYKIIKRETKGVSAVEFLRLIKKPIAFLVSLVIVSWSFEQLEFATHWRVIPLGKMTFNTFIDKVLETLFIFTITWLLIGITRFIALIWAEKAKETETQRDDQLVPFFRDLFITFLIFISFFVILGYVFKQDVVSLITGLGIGGVALALAARETLENLFASFTIFFDKPFSAGDTVEIGTTHQGDVEKIGFRTTRLRTPDGSLLNVPNRLMVSQNVNNLSLRTYRRVKFWLKIKNDTPAESIEKLIVNIKKLIADHPKTNSEAIQPYVLLDAFGVNSLDILVVYFVSEIDYRLFKNIMADFNTAILAEIRVLDIQFAVFPEIIVPNKSGTFWKLNLKSLEVTKMILNIVL